MTTYQSSIILREMLDLIAYSCNDSVRSMGNANTGVFHRSIIKKYFKAREVRIRYDEKEVIITLPSENNPDFYIPITLDYDNLQDFLKSCIERDLRSLSFYQHVLGYFTSTAKAS